MTQFFILRDLRYNRSIVEQLRDSGRFAPEYKPVIDKLIAGYYDSSQPSTKLTWTFEARLREAKAIEDIAWIWSYGRYAVMYELLVAFSGFYLLFFRRRSVLALTSKGRKLAENERVRTANNVQLAYGVLASLIATVIWTYGLDKLIGK